MKKLITTLIFVTTASCFCCGQIQTETVEQDSLFIEVYIDAKGKIFLYEEKISMTKLEAYLAKTELNNAKFATVFPTPLKVFAIVEKVHGLFEKFKIEEVWYKDPEFTIPAWK